MLMVVNIIRKLYNVSKGALSKVFMLFPIKNDLVVLDNFGGRGYGCNPKYIAEALSDSGLKLVWLVRGGNQDFPKYIKTANLRLPLSWYYLSRARVRVSNVRDLKGVAKRKGQFLIQTWHGMLAFKKIEADAETMLSEEYIRLAKEDGRATDLMIVNNDVDKKRYEESFWYSGQVLKIGLPRMQPIVFPDRSIKRSIFESLQIPDGSKVVLFAPTFRDTNCSFVPQLDLKQVGKAFDDTFGGHHLFLIRLHPNVSIVDDEIVKGYHADVGFLVDAQMLLSAVDVLITDYSSIIFDFSLGMKPAFIFAPDYKEYTEHSREMYSSLEDYPYPIAYDTQQLVSQIYGFSEKEMRRRYNEFFEGIGLTEDGRGAQRVADIIINKCKGDSGK